MRAHANGIEIEYEIMGDAQNPTIMLIMGLGVQMIRYPLAFYQLLVDKGFQVIRFDNRDVGLSTKFEGLTYTLGDMATDVIGLMDALDISTAHIVGVSMGGHIAQVFTYMYPERALSLTSIMASTGNPNLPPPTEAALDALLTAAPDPAVDMDAFIANRINLARILGSPAYPQDETMLRERTLIEYNRSFYPTGMARQFNAIISAGDRREQLKAIATPTVVLHGTEDPLVALAGGQDTANNILNAELIAVPGMGHDMPPELYETVVDAIMRAAKKSGAKNS